AIARQCRFGADALASANPKDRRDAHFFAGLRIENEERAGVAIGFQMLDYSFLFFCPEFGSASRSVALDPRIEFLPGAVVYPGIAAEHRAVAANTLAHVQNWIGADDYKTAAILFDYHRVIISCGL